MDDKDRLPEFRLPAPGMALLVTIGYLLGLGFVTLAVFNLFRVSQIHVIYTIASILEPLILVFPLILCLLLLVRIFCFPAQEPAYVYFGDLKTFRDLSETIAVHEAARIC